MGQALRAADLAVVTDVYGAREQPIPGVTGRLVADAAREAGARVIYEPDRGGLGQRVFAELGTGDLLLTLGAGDVTHLAREVRVLLEGR